MNKRFHILLLGLGAIFGASLCHAVAAAPPRVTSEKVVSFKCADLYCITEIALCDVDAFNQAAMLERETIAHAVHQSAADSRTTNHQAKVSAYGRTCRSIAIAADYRSKPLTEYEQRM